MSLKISGYDHKFRHTLLKGILAKQLDIDSKVRDGQRSLYRSRDQILAMKAEKLGKHPETWSLRGTNQNTFKCPKTPGGKLAEFLRSKLENELGAEGGTTKCVELGGDLVTRGLSGTVTSTGSQGYSFPVKCNIDPDQNCAIRRNVYEVECTTCIEDQEPK